MAENTQRKRRVYIAVGIVAALIIAAFAWLPVCDEQLTDDGKVVNVCRHVATTDPPVILLGVLVLVMLSGFYAEISGFGITLKSRVSELEQRSEQTERKADDLQVKAQDLQVKADDLRVKAEDLQVTVGDLTDFNREQIVPQMLGPQARTATLTPEQTPDPRVVDLVNEYNNLRWTLPSSDERTRKMQEVVAKLRRVLSDATGFDAPSHLEDADRGVRLAAFVYLQDHARPDMMPAIVTATAREDKPFGQYHALRAVLRQIALGAHLTEPDRRTLGETRDRIGHKNDRTPLINELLGES